MTRFFLPIILIGASIATFLFFVTPYYAEISASKEEIASYDQALSNSKALENERDKLTQKFNSITTTDLDRIKKLLPENVDNIRLILEIEKLASPFGMALRDVKYNPTKTNANSGTTQAPGTALAPDPTISQKEYGVWDLEFSTIGTYTNFLNFIKALESNLRIVDISAVDFSSAEATTAGTGAPSTYRYSFKIKTYWLKN